MKKQTIFAFLLLFLITGSILTGCGEEDNNPQPQLSNDIRAMVPQSILDEVKKHGFKIHPGMKPPNLEGIFLISPTYCTYDNSDDNLAGDTFDDYKYKYYNQDNRNLTIKIDDKSLQGADTGKGKGGFIAGSGKSFSIFSEIKGTEDGIAYTHIQIYSGTMTSKGIQNYQEAIYIKSKGADPDHKLADVGTIRLFKDKDGLAEKVSTY